MLNPPLHNVMEWCVMKWDYLVFFQIACWWWAIRGAVLHVIEGVPNYEKLHWTFASPQKLSLWSVKEKAYSPSKLWTVVHFPYLNEFVGGGVRTIRCLSLQCTICSGLAPGSPLIRQVALLCSRTLWSGTKIWDRSFSNPTPVAVCC